MILGNEDETRKKGDSLQLSGTQGPFRMSEAVPFLFLTVVPHAL